MALTRAQKIAIGGIAAVIILIAVAAGIMYSIVGTSPFPYTPPAQSVPAGNSAGISSYTWGPPSQNICRTNPSPSNICTQDYPGVSAPTYLLTLNGIYNYTSSVGVTWGAGANGNQCDGYGTVNGPSFNVYLPDDYTNSTLVSIAEYLNTQTGKNFNAGAQPCATGSVMNSYVQTFLSGVNSYIQSAYTNATYVPPSNSTSKNSTGSSSSSAGGGGGGGGTPTATEANKTATNSTAKTDSSSSSSSSGPSIWSQIGQAISNFFASIAAAFKT